MEQRPLLNLTIDNQPVSVAPGTTLWEAARIAGIRSPFSATARTWTRRRSAASARCTSRARGSSPLPASVPPKRPWLSTPSLSRCSAPAASAVELLLADHPRPCEQHRVFGNCELELLGEQLGIGEPRFPGRSGVQAFGCSGVQEASSQHLNTRTPEHLKTASPSRTPPPPSSTLITRRASCATGASGRATRCR